MSKITFDIPSEVRSVLVKHSEIQWDQIVNNALWQYAKKIQLMDRLITKSKLTKKDVSEVDHIIKGELLKKYKRA